MSNSLPEQEEPVSLRSTRELGARPQEPAAPPATAPSMSGSPPSDPQAQWLTPTTLAGAGVAVLAAGWVMQRRHHLAQQVPPDGVQTEPESERGPLAALPPPANEPLMELPEAAQQTHHRPTAGLGVPAQKRLIRFLMWLRTVTGAAAILAAIAIVVFWLIEAMDHRAGETGLNMPLVVLVLAGWAASWGAGQLANMLHRMFFGRVHPKFDD